MFFDHAVVNFPLTKLHKYIRTSEKFITASTKKIIKKNISKTSSSCYIVHITLIINRDVAHHIAFFLSRAMPRVLNVSSYTCISLYDDVYMSNSSRSRIALLHINDIVPVLLESQKCVCWGCVCCCYTYKNVSAAHTILNEPISLSLQKEKKAGLLPGSDAIYSCYSKFLKI